MAKFLSGLYTEIKFWILSILNFIPGVVGVKIRYFCYKPFFISCGENISFAQGCQVRKFKNISLGSNINLGPYSQIYAGEKSDGHIEMGSNVDCNSNVMINADCGGSIKIGSNVLIGPNVVLRASDHVFTKRDTPIRQQGHEIGEIIIEDDVWIAANAVILPNVTVKKGAIVGAGAVVTKDVETYTIVGGVPAKPIGMRPDK